jgi:nitrite reductase/ring-hydroxylating ferredoxin subunit
MKPTGWFQVAWSNDLTKGTVIPLRYFGEDLVAYRDFQGEVHVLDAYCQHLGANLAYGGCVTEQGIQCPFHGWEWGHNGRNVSIPYQDRPNRGRRVRSWPVQERNESIHIWHDADGRDPYFDVFDAIGVGGSVLDDYEFYPVTPQHLTGLEVHPQMVAENAVDPQHFRFVHGTKVAPVVLAQETTDSSWHAIVGFGRRWAEHRGPVTDTMNTLRLWFSGLGTSVNVEQTADGIRIITINTTPVDDDTTDIFAGYWLDRGPGDDAERRDRRLRDAMAALPDDINIWNRQKYLLKPGLAGAEDKGFIDLRQWASSFYPDGGPVSTPADADAVHAS